MPKSLPAAPRLEHLKKQAKDLLQAYRKRRQEVLPRIRQHLPRLAATPPGELFDARFSLADAQLVIAREYGFASWPRLKRHVEARTTLTDEVVEQWKAALQANDVSRVKALFKQYPALDTKVNEPLFGFGARPLNEVKHNRALVDLLLKHGADINGRSDWWAGSFGLLDGADAATAAFLIERGATVDVHAAAALGHLDRLRELIAADPELVNAKGGDGQRPLHFATKPEVIDFLLAHGADINARDVDHCGTPAQYAINDQVKCRYLIERGAEPDIFIACVLGDINLAKAVMAADPHCLDARIGAEPFTAPGEHIYAYTIGYTARPLDLAAQHGHQKSVDFLWRRSSPRQRLLFACVQADAAKVKRIVRSHPDLVGSLAPADRSLICDAAWRNNTAAVRVMLDAGFDIDTRGVHNSTPLDRAALWGYLDTVQLLLDRGASLTVRNEFGGTPLGACIHGSLHFQCDGSDHAGCVEAMLRAGASLPAQAAGSDAVRAVLLRHGAKA